MLLVGDAAGLVDPLSGDGMYEAFVSARLAADAIVAGDLERLHRGALGDARPPCRRLVGREARASTAIRAPCSPPRARRACSRWSPACSAATSPTRRTRAASPAGRSSSSRGSPADSRSFLGERLGEQRRRVRLPREIVVGEEERQRLAGAAKARDLGRSASSPARSCARRAGCRGRRRAPWRPGRTGRAAGAGRRPPREGAPHAGSRRSARPRRPRRRDPRRSRASSTARPARPARPTRTQSRIVSRATRRSTAAGDRGRSSVAVVPASWKPADEAAASRRSG